MPFYTNNVDLTVCANNLYAITNYILSISPEEAKDIFDDDLQ